MRFVVDSEELRQAIKVMDAIVPKRTPMEILKGVFVSCSKAKGLFMAGTDITNWAVFSFEEYDREKTGRKLLPFELLQGVLSHAKKCRVEFDGERVSFLSSKASVSGMPVTEFPDIPEVPEDYVEVPSESLKLLAKRVAVAADDEDYRTYNTSGLMLRADLKEGHLSGICRDSHSVCVCHAPIVDESERFWEALDERPKGDDLVMEVDVLKAIVRGYEAFGDTVRLSYDDRNVFFSKEKLTVITRQMFQGFAPGTISGYRRIGKSFEVKFEFPREQFVEVVEIASKAALQRADTAKIVFERLDGDDRMEVYANSEVGTSRAKIPCPPGFGFKLPVNYKLLQRPMRSLGTDQVEVAFSMATSDRTGAKVAQHISIRDDDDRFHYILAGFFGGRE